jgi:hypothetical protein
MDPIGLLEQRSGFVPVPTLELIERLLDELAILGPAVRIRLRECDGARRCEPRENQRERKTCDARPTYSKALAQSVT